MKILFKNKKIVMKIIQQNNLKKEKKEEKGIKIQQHKY
jgi:hypothetical protein